MEKFNVIRTRELDLCVSCEICVVTCPVEAITMEFTFGQFLPKINENRCNMCGLCIETCPGIDILPIELKERKCYEAILIENYFECYTAYSNDPKIRKNSISGGLITHLIIELIKDKTFDAVFILNFDKFNGKPARLTDTNNIDLIFNSAKSKYICASAYQVLKVLKNNNKKKFIIIGTPCVIFGIKKFIKKFNISEKPLLFLGLFCDCTLNFNILRYYENIYAKHTEKITNFQFRTKEKYGWPGHSKIIFDSKRILFVDRNVRMSLKKYFRLNRCLFCFDKLNRLADISFGDCYIGKTIDLNGKSSVIIRTKKGNEIFRKYSFLFTLKKEKIERILKSQKILEKKKNFNYAKLFHIEISLHYKKTLEQRLDRKAKISLFKLQKYIKWGKNYDINKIKFNLLVNNKLNMLISLFNFIKYKNWNIKLRLEGLLNYIRNRF